MSLGLSMKLLTMVYLLGHCPWTFKPLSQKKRGTGVPLDPEPGILTRAQKHHVHQDHSQPQDQRNLESQVLQLII